MQLTYKGFNLKAYEQVFIPPFKQFVCVASKEIKNKITGFNIEGVSLEDAMQKAKDKIDENIY